MGATIKGRNFKWETADCFCYQTNSQCCYFGKPPQPLNIYLNPTKPLPKPGMLCVYHCNCVNDDPANVYSILSR